MWEAGHAQQATAQKIARTLEGTGAGSHVSFCLAVRRQVNPQVLEDRRSSDKTAVDMNLHGAPFDGDGFIAGVVNNAVILSIVKHRHEGLRHSNEESHIVAEALKYRS